MKYEIDKTYYSLDWIHGVCQSACVGNLFEALALADERLEFQNFAQFSKGIFNYSTRFGLNNKSYITIGYNQRSDDEPFSSEVDEWGLYSTSQGFNTGIFVSITGDGIRFLGSDSLNKVMKVLYDFNFRCSRLDVACDIFDPNNPYVPHLDEAFLNNCNLDEVGQLTLKSDMTRRHLKAFFNRDPYRPQNNGFTRSWTWGHSGSSRCMFRMYDKWLEMKDGRLSEYDTQLDDLPSDYWYRFEYEMHKKYAEALFNMLVEGSCNVPAAFAYCAERCFYPVYNSFTSVTQQDFSRGELSDIWQYFISLASDYVVEPSFDFVQLEFSEERRMAYFKHMSPLFYSFYVTMRHCQELESIIFDEGAKRFFENKANIPLINQLGGLSEERFLHTRRCKQNEFIVDQDNINQISIPDEAYSFISHNISSNDIFTPLSDGAIQLVLECV